MNMTEAEKKRFIDSDFDKNVISKMPKMPGTKAEAQKWWHRQHVLWMSWLQRYKDNSMKEYAHKLMFDLSDMYSAKISNMEG